VFPKPSVYQSVSQSVTDSVVYGGILRSPHFSSTASEWKVSSNPPYLPSSHCTTSNVVFHQPNCAPASRMLLYRRALRNRLLTHHLMGQPVTGDELIQNTLNQATSHFAWLRLCKHISQVLQRIHIRHRTHTLSTSLTSVVVCNANTLFL
jgi:hypothetical protein